MSKQREIKRRSRARVGNLPIGLAALDKLASSREVPVKEAIQLMAEQTTAAINAAHQHFVNQGVPEELVIGATSFAALNHVAGCQYAAAELTGLTMSNARARFMEHAEKAWQEIEALHSKVVAGEMEELGLTPAHAPAEEQTEQPAPSSPNNDTVH